MKKQTSFILPALVLVLFTTGCLRTRSDIQKAETKKEFQDQIAALQTGRADAQARFQEIQDEIRNLNGRIDNLQNRMNQALLDKSEEANSSAQQEATLKARVQLLEEALLSLEKNVRDLGAKKAKAKKKPKSAYDKGEAEFEAKNWKKAILSYQDYRDKDSKGEHFPDATYKIGVCFQELGMKNEAKVFYEEVVEKFPKSREAKKAQYRLDNL